LRLADPPSEGPLDCKIHNFIINSEWEQARQPNPSRKKRKKKKMMMNNWDRGVKSVEAETE
jgi:hypothetical protein